jgi:DNA-binding response OmpR family regulator
LHIYLPPTQAQADNRKMLTAVVTAPECRGATVLLVDDDDAVREVAAATLRVHGYRVLEAGSGGAALDLVDRESGIDLMVVDFAMPGMSGAEVARRVYAKRPRLPILFVTGFADRTALAGIGGAQIIGKPFMDGELANKVRSMLASDGSRCSPTAAVR